MSELGLGSVGGRGTRGRRRMGGCLAALVALAIIVAVGFVGYHKGVDLIKGWISGPADYAGQGHGSVVVEVASGDTSSDIGSTLVKADVVKSVDAFTNAAKKDDRSLSIQVGYYRMRHQMSGADALALMLKPGTRISTSITIPEGMRAKEIAKLIVSKTSFTAQEVNAAMNNTSALGLPSYAKGEVEGYLYPATYPVTPATTPLSLLKAMVERFTQEAASVHLVAGANAVSMTPTQVVEIASLVQAEASRPQDFPKVARVIYNRLHVDMPLQLDSTLHYAVDSRGVVQANQALRDLDTPYNTYKLAGLPPTAIDSPGEVALKAALHPANGPWIYFVTVNFDTGETLFATTLAQQDANEHKLGLYCQTSSLC